MQFDSNVAADSAWPVIQGVDSGLGTRTLQDGWERRLGKFCCKAEIEMFCHKK